MKKLYVILPLIILFLGCFNLVNAQECTEADEADLTDLCVTATETANGPNTSMGTFDVWDAGTNAAGTDGTPDVEMFMEAVVFTPNGNGTCDDGDFTISGCVGGAGAGDWGATTSNDCYCTNGYVCVTVDMINGFSSDAAGLDFNFTSVNGSTEGHEAMFAYVTAGTDANGTPLTTLPTVNLSLLNGFCEPQYNAGPVSAFVGATGPGTFAVDQNTGVTNNCASSGQGGEDTDSGDNPNDNSDAQTEAPNWGLNATDIITQYKMVYFFGNTPGTECDADGDTGVGSNPSANFGVIDFCPPPPPCTISSATATAVCDTADPNNAVVTVTFDEANSSGSFNILDSGSAIVGTATGTGAGITTTFTVTGPITPAMTGVTYTIQDGTETTCTADVMVDIPECVVLCPDYTATISGGGQVCNNEPVDLIVTMDGGTGPYTVTLSDGTVITGYMSGTAIPVAPTMNTTYGVATVLDADGCPAMVAGSAEVMVIISCANAGSLNGG